jgi:superoxide reductase
MAERFQVYRCNTCGNIVLVMHGGKGELVCCGNPMELLKESSTDAAIEKHVPVIEKEGEVYKVKVGKVPHPMKEEHYIEWIELHTDDNKICIRFLKPGEEPSAVFEIKAESASARAYCNLHGLWKS